MATYQLGDFEITIELKLPICYISILPPNQSFLYELELTKEKILGDLVKTVEKFYEILVDFLEDKNRDIARLCIGAPSADKQSITLVLNLDFRYCPVELKFILIKNNKNLLKLYTAQEKIIRELIRENQDLKYKIKFDEKYQNIIPYNSNKLPEELLIINSDHCRILPECDNKFFINLEYPCSVIWPPHYCFYINTSDQIEFPITYRYKYITKMVLANIDYSINLDILKHNLNLTHLCLLKGHIEDISILTKMEQLEVLFIFECKSIKNLNIIDEIKNLKILGLSYCMDFNSKNKKYIQMRMIRQPSSQSY